MPHPSLEDAIALAASLHKGQVDKAGQPYILHPLKVMLGVKTETERMVAVLHDVVEDCGITFEKLTELGYPHEVVEALRFVTKQPGAEDDYEAFIERVAIGPRAAINVKLSDLAQNMDPSRLTNPTGKDRLRAEKYARAQARLLQVTSKW